MSNSDPYYLGPNSLDWIDTLKSLITSLAAAYRREKPKDKALRRFCTEIDYTVSEAGAGRPRPARTDLSGAGSGHGVIILSTLGRYQVRRLVKKLLSNRR